MPDLSIIIPTLNEAAVIVDTLTRLRAAAPEAELVVADGNSSDDTAALARPLARVVESPRGRAIQMSRGAEAAHGAWLLFLHADTTPPPTFAQEIEKAAASGYLAGVFRLAIAGRHPLLPLLAWGANLRSRLLGIALGDQGLFVEREFFRARGGFPQIALMEDFAFTRSLRREGTPLYLSSLAIQTSGRRWDEAGFFRTWWRMRSNYLQFRMGRDPESLSGKYRDVR